MNPCTCMNPFQVDWGIASVGGKVEWWMWCVLFYIDILCLFLPDSSSGVKGAMMSLLHAKRFQQVIHTACWCFPSSFLTRRSTFMVSVSKPTLNTFRSLRVTSDIPLKVSCLARTVQRKSECNHAVVSFLSLWTYELNLSNYISRMPSVH